MTAALFQIEEHFKASTHNGCVTISNPETGNHRTFKVETMPSDAKFAPGKRVVSLFVGTNNTDKFEYKGFAFVDERGIRIWKRFAEDRDYLMFASMLERPQHWQTVHGLVYEIEARCRRCGSLLTNPDSIRDGIGPVCNKNERYTLNGEVFAMNTARGKQEAANAAE